MKRCWCQCLKNGKYLLVYFSIINLLIISVYFIGNRNGFITSEYVKPIFNTTEKQYLSSFQKNNFTDRLSFERRKICNYRNHHACYFTNKSLIATFWGEKSKEKWISQNMLSSFPSDSFDYVVFLYDNSSWLAHPGYKQFIWIRVDRQLRYWFLKRFLSPTILKAYDFLWIIDDDAQFSFRPLHYQCVIKRLDIHLSAPARLTGPLSHGITRTNWEFKNRIGRWVDFVEVGPIVILSSIAWQCIYRYLDASTSSGWGLDMIWCNIVARRCWPTYQQNQVCAILDIFGVHHQSDGMYSIDDGLPEISVYTDAYKELIAKRQNLGSLANDSFIFEHCQKEH